jgi:hypothetical protein
MPSLDSRIREVSDNDIDDAPQQLTYSPSSPPPLSAEPGLNASLCCPLPLVSAYPDNLRQFYRQGVPQTRIIPITKG